MRPFFLVSLLALCQPVAGNDAVLAMVAMLQGVIDDMDTARHNRDLQCVKDLETLDAAISSTSTDVERYKSKESQLEATIVRDNADSDALTTQIQKDQNTLTAKDAEKKGAQAQRAGDNDAFNKKQGEQSEIIQTIRGAIAALDRGGQSLLQGKPQEAVMKTIPAIKAVVSALSLTSQSSKQLEALVQAQTEGDDDFGTYVSRGSDVMALLHGILEDASTAYTETKATEQNDLFEHNRLVQELNNEMTTLQTAITQNKQALAGKKANIAADTASIEVARTNLNSSVALLATLKQDSAQTDKECKEYLQDAQEQINSMNEAVKVLNSDSMQNAGIGLLFVQTGVSYNDNSENEDQARAARFLSDMAERLGSPVLAQIGNKVAAGKFDFVIRMIEDMLLKLNNIASHSDFCEEQLKIDEQASTDKQQRVDRAETSFDKLTAEVQQLKTDLADAVDSQNKKTQELTALTANRAAAQRENSQNSRNLATVAEGFDTAISALEKAMAESPGGGNKQVLDTLREKSADVKRQAVKWAALESGDDKDFKKLKGDIEADIAGNQRLERLLRKDLITKRAELAQSEAELHDLQVQLGAVQGTLATQKKDCQVSEVNDADRARRTEKEKLALQEALAILKSEGDISPGPWTR